MTSVSVSQRFWRVILRGGTAGFWTADAFEAGRIPLPTSPLACRSTQPRSKHTVESCHRHRSGPVRFTKQVVSLARYAVAGAPNPAYKPGDGGYADWVIVAIHGLREYLDHPYRWLVNVLYEMPRIVGIIGLEPAEFPDCSTVCARYQGLKMSIWRVLVGLSAKLHDTGEIQENDATERRSKESAKADGIVALLTEPEMNALGCDIKDAGYN